MGPKHVIENTKAAEEPCGVASESSLIAANAPRRGRGRESAKAARLRAGLSLIAAAVGGGTSQSTVRLYEADRFSVSPKKRAALDAFYAPLYERVSRPEGPRAA